MKTNQNWIIYKHTFNLVEAWNVGDLCITNVIWVYLQHNRFNYNHKNYYCGSTSTHYMLCVICTNTHNEEEDDMISTVICNSVVEE